jgi:hypothetical protein
MTAQQSNFPLLISSLAPEYAEASYDQLVGIVEAVYGLGSSPESVEGLFGDIGRGLSSAARSVGNFAQQAAPVVARALPNMIQGATTGASMGGPWGALIGGLAGGASGIMQQSNNPNVRDVGNVMHSVGGMVGSLRGGGLGGGGNALGAIASGGQGNAPGAANILGSLFGNRSGGSGGSSALMGQTPASTGGAANGLMGMLTRPETLQALLSAGMGAFGNRNLQIGGQQVPVHSILSTLSSLAGRAASEAAEFAESAEATPAFAQNSAEALGINPESAEGRTDALLTLLALTPSIWASNRPVQPPVTLNLAQLDPTGFPMTLLTAPQAESSFGATEFDESWPEWPDFEWLAGGSQEMIHA